MSCQLILHAFDAPLIGVTEEKPDHSIVEHSVNESIDDGS
jgi:hypothetical protein